MVAAVPPVQALLDVQAEQERLMQRIGLEPEGRKYTPHVTLARLRDASSFAVADYLSARGYFRTAAFRVSQFVLFSSRNSVGGGPYVVEASYPLRIILPFRGAPKARTRIQMCPGFRVASLRSASGMTDFEVTQPSTAAIASRK